MSRVLADYLYPPQGVLAMPTAPKKPASTRIRKPTTIAPPVPEPTITPTGEPIAIATLKTPDVTPAQVIGMIPLVAEALHAFGVYSMSQAQQDSLTKLMLGGIALFGADAVVRVGRALSRKL